MRLPLALALLLCCYPAEAVPDVLVPSRRALQAAAGINPVQNGDCYGSPTIRPDGRGVAGSVDRGGQNVCYTLAARQGETYTITADLNGLDDSIVAVLNAQGTSLGENDDADDGSGTLGSQLEWTCPSTGTYYVVVRGYEASNRGAFVLSVAIGGGGATDPCAGSGLPLAGQNSGVISFTNSYADGATCTWSIQCASTSDHVEVT